jgi:hydroxyacylglutathione hydrolase
MNQKHITFVNAFTDNYIWILINEDHRAAICVDPGEALPLLAFLNEQKLDLKAILLTHHHQDHAGGVAQLLQKYPEAVIYGAKDARLDVFSEPILHESHFSIKGFTFQTLETSGHTSSHVCFYETALGLVFSGDTLFSAGCGRIFDGTASNLFESLKLLKALPDETKVYCGHEYTRKNLQFAAQVEPDNLVIHNYLQELLKHPHKPSLPSTIALEKQINPFLRLEEVAVMQYARSRGCYDESAFAVFKQLRSDKDLF